MMHSTDLFGGNKVYSAFPIAIFNDIAVIWLWQCPQKKVIVVASNQTSNKKNRLVMKIES